MRSMSLILWSSCLWGVLALTATAEMALEAPGEVAAGASFQVTWSGDTDPKDFLTLVAPDLPEGKYGRYEYTRKKPLSFMAPDDPGDYELRLLSKDVPYTTLARRPITVTPVTASLEGPASIEAGGTIEVTWQGPGHERDFITVVKADANEQSYGTYVYTKRGNPARLKVPEDTGDYEIRYLTGQKYYTLASHPFSITSVAASIEGPSSVTEGADFEVRFEGTGNPRDFVTIVPADAPEGDYGRYSYIRDDKSIQLTAPGTAGAYEIRYLTAQKYRTLASQPIEVVAAGATLEAQDEVRGGEYLPVTWSGVGNDNDYITIVEPAAEDREYGNFAYIRNANPVRIQAPFKPGDYELRYALGASHRVLARRPLRVTEPETPPGALLVVSSTADKTVALPEGAAVEVILDASGSMLKRQDGQRRIDIAKSVLSDLVRESLPSATPFAMRVFGHREADSCRTDLEISLSPLDATAAASRISGVEAMNLAKTPIAKSLELVAQDLAGVEGTSVVVLVTDGEETCGGDPAAAVEKLRGLGFDVRVNIVGFAIDDDDLKSQFRYWADLGGGAYHDAAGATDLATSIRESLQASFDVLDAGGETVASGSVSGGSVELPAGSYRVRVEGRAEEIPITVMAGDTTVVDLTAPER